MAATLTAARSAVQAVHALQTVKPGASPTPDQRAALEGFPGWGAAAPLFDPQPAKSWAALADELDDLDPTAMNAAARVVDTSFYTPPALIEHIYHLLRQAGFRGGNVLDLGCGNARFLTHAPADLPITYTGVEVDPTTAAIAAALHPAATIIADRLQDVSLPANRFDAAVGNVPFSSANVHDSAIAFYGPLHEYFLVRAVRAVRPGGYVVMATSRHTVDSANGLSYSVRSHADLMAAIRLPSGYFAAEGTAVVADVLVLRARDTDEPHQGWDAASPATPSPATTNAATVPKLASVRSGARTRNWSRAPCGSPGITRTRLPWTAMTPTPRSPTPSAQPSRYYCPTRRQATPAMRSPTSR